MANVFALLIFSHALFHTSAASMVKLFFARVDPPVPVRSPWVPAPFLHAFYFNFPVSLISFLFDTAGHLRLSTAQ